MLGGAKPNKATLWWQDWFRVLGWGFIFRLRVLGQDFRLRVLSLSLGLGFRLGVLGSGS